MEETKCKQKVWKLSNFCEFNSYAARSYCAIHNESESKNLGDITKVDETALEPFTMICGGSPCQDFSIAGKQKGSVWTCKECGHKYNPLTVHFSKRGECPECHSEDIEKTRSSLLVEWLRIIRENKPKFGIYENVKNIVGKQFKETTFKMFENELNEYGYNTYWKVLNARNYGIPQNRERLYLILIKKELDNGKFEFPEEFDNGLKLSNFLDCNVDEKYYISEKRLDIIYNNLGNVFDKNFVIGSSQKHTYVGDDSISPNLTSAMGLGGGQTPMVDQKKVLESKLPKERFFRQAIETFIENEPQAGDTIDAFNRRINKSGCCPTITTRPEGFKTAILPVVSNDEDDCLRIRKFTPKECFKLMGFEEKDYQAAKDIGMSDSQMYKQAGNSIVVDVLYHIYKSLYAVMPYLFEDLTLGSYFSGIGAFEKALDRLFEDINHKM